MRILIAPNSFKNCLGARAVGEAIARGFRAARPDTITDIIPMSDGGDGLVEVLANPLAAERLETATRDALGRKLKADWLLTGEFAVIEMALASGLARLRGPEEYRPLVTSTAGTGLLIRAALDRGCRHIVVGLGGSATVDGGAGMAQALGFRLLDAAHRELPPGGAALSQLVSIDPAGAHPRLRDCPILVACDVTNPLLGPTGSVAVFGPQKGATPAMMPVLEAGLAQLAKVWLDSGLLASVTEPGDGAAGGLGAGLRAFCHAQLVSGARLVADAVGLKAALEGADLVITGEGCSDASTAYGKLPAVVAELARGLGFPTVLVAGGLRGDTRPLEAVFAGVFPICGNAMPLDEAIRRAPADLERTARSIIQLWIAACGSAKRLQ